jgi:glycosyltransferase involved in cell wall biosynthesis
MVARPSEFPSVESGLSRDALTSRTPVRVLHVVESLDNQAVETWLIRVLRAAALDYPDYQWTFFCILGKTGRYDDEARSLGAEVIHSDYEVGDKRRFLLGLREVMKRGRYDVLHCHHDIMSAAYLAASAGLAFRKRIVHLHNTELGLPTSSRLKAGLAREPMRQMCLHMADQIVGISNEALQSLIGTGTSDPLRHQVVHYAVDTARFMNAQPDRDRLLHSLQLEPSRKILLFVGRLVDYKNPCFVVEILEQLNQAGEEFVALFAGTGDQEERILALAKVKGLDDRVRLLGFRDDVPELMRSADLLIWPSREDTKEGLGLGIVESQAAGLPILMSQSVPEEAIVVSESVKVVPLAAGAKIWARAAVELLNSPRPAFAESLARVDASTFSMAQGVANLMALYV